MVAMTFLLDASTFSHLMRKHPQASGRLASLDPADKVIICPIVRGEVLHGLELLPQGRRRAMLTKQAAPLFATIRCEPVPESAGDTYARIKYHTVKRGRTVAENDLWIAATAAALNATLVTSDTDFGRVPALMTADWTV